MQCLFDVPLSPLKAILKVSRGEFDGLVRDQLHSFLVGVFGLFGQGLILWET